MSERRQPPLRVAASQQRPRRIVGQGDQKRSDPGLLSAEHGLTDAFRHLHPTAAEYSWVGRTGDGYRYDHVFCSASLCPLIASCQYVHEPREDGLSDHSALTAGFTLRPSPGLRASDPAASSMPATLF
jgi:exodeoxyribonuclease-3